MPREEVVHDVVGLVGTLGIARQATGQAGNHSLGVVDDKLCGHVAEDAVDHAAWIRVLHNTLFIEYKPTLLYSDL